MNAALWWSAGSQRLCGHNEGNLTEILNDEEVNNVLFSKVPHFYCVCSHLYVFCLEYKACSHLSI